MTAHHDSPHSPRLCTLLTGCMLASARWPPLAPRCAVQQAAQPNGGSGRLCAVCICRDVGQPWQGWFGQLQHYTNSCTEPEDRGATGWRSVAASRSDALLKAGVGCRSRDLTLAIARQGNVPKNHILPLLCKVYGLAVSIAVMTLSTGCPFSQ